MLHYHGHNSGTTLHFVIAFTWLLSRLCLAKTLLLWFLINVILAILSLQKSLLTRDALIRHLKAILCKAQNYMKIQVDKRRRNFQLADGDYALVKLQPYRQHFVQLRKNQKIGMRFFGSFLVLQRIGAIAYKLQLPKTTRIHPVFHISLLKKFHRDCPQ